MSQHFRALERMYHQAACNQYYAPRLSVSKGETELEIEVRSDFFHAMQAVHGSVYFKALDDAAYFAANSLVEEVAVLTASFHLHMLRPVTEGVLKAVGRVVRPGRNLIVAEARLLDSQGRELARGSGDFMRSQLLLKETPGYSDSRG